MNSRKKVVTPARAPHTTTAGTDAEAAAGRVFSLLGDNTIASIYRLQVRSGRTRRYELPPPVKNWSAVRVEIMHTLLGIELKIGRQRLSCPDLSTARYLALFARLGVAAVALPYDITRIARLADELESSWHRMIMLAEDESAGRSEHFRKRFVRFLILRQRQEVEDLGPGPVAPQFNR